MLCDKNYSDNKMKLINYTHAHTHTYVCDFKNMAKKTYGCK